MPLKKIMSESKFVKIKVNKLYFLPSGDVVRVVRINWMRNSVIVHNYHSHSNEVVEYELAPAILSPAYRIGEVARMLGKQPATLRKYEQLGLIPKVRKISLNFGEKRFTRVYTSKDVEEIVEFFDRRKPVGRPSRTNTFGINKNEIKRILNSRYIKEDNG